MREARPLLEARRLTVRYPRAAAPALREVSLTLWEGETLLLLGPSGCGKSTLGLCLAGLIPASAPALVEGEVLLADPFDAGAPLRDGADWPLGRRTAALGMVFQDPESQFCTLTVEDEVAFGLENQAVPPEEMPWRIREALRSVGLLERRRERVDRLSGGGKQRLALACALARRPPILFLDEPTANLDPQARWEFYALLRQLRGENPRLAILLVEHVLDDLIEGVDRVMLLDHEGRAGAAGPPRQIFRQAGDTLDELGIWLPQVTALGRRLLTTGVTSADPPLTVEEAAAAWEKSLLIRRLPAPPAPPCAPGGTPALEARRLTFAYPGHSPTLRSADMSVPVGAFAALVGPNGAGKTTLAAMFADILRPAPGQAFLAGGDVATLSTREISAQAGFVFQNPEHQFIERTVEDDLAYGLRVRRRPADVVGAEVSRLLDDFGLAGHRRRNPFTLSQGQKRRLSVASMLIGSPSILILDEPTFGQDRESAGALMARLCALHAAGETLLMITHDMQLVADYAGLALVLVDGVVRFNGPPGDLFSRPALLEEASLRPPPLHQVARRLDVSYEDGTLPLSLRDWYPFFGLEPAPARREAASHGCRR